MIKSGTVIGLNKVRLDGSGYVKAIETIGFSFGDRVDIEVDEITRKCILRPEEILYEEEKTLTMVEIERLCATALPSDGLDQDCPDSIEYTFY